MLAPVTELPDEFRPLRREEYDRLIDLGVFEGTKVQLVGGLLVEMTPQKGPHFQLIADLTMILTAQVMGRHTVSVQGPLQVDDISEPEPDLAILPLPRYRGVGKTGDALLVIEVAESSLRFDLGEKARRYAAAGYPEYWVIDCVARVLIRHTEPSPDGTWGSIERLDSGVLELIAVADATLDLDHLFDF